MKAKNILAVLLLGVACNKNPGNQATNGGGRTTTPPQINSGSDNGNDKESPGHNSNNTHKSSVTEEALQKENALLKNQITILKSELTSLKKSPPNSSSTSEATLKSQLQNVTKEKNDLEKQVTLLAAANKTLALEKENIVKKATLPTPQLAAENTDLKMQVEKLTAENTDLKVQVKKLTAENKKLALEKEDIVKKATLQPTEENTKLNSENKNLKEQVKKLTAENKLLSEENVDSKRAVEMILEKENTIKALEKEVFQLKCGNTQLAEREKELTAENKKLALEKERLEKQPLLTDENKDLKEQVKKLTEENNKLAAEKERLEKQSLLTDENKDLKEQVKKLTEENKKLIAEMEEITHRICKDSMILDAIEPNEKDKITFLKKALENHKGKKITKCVFLYKYNPEDIKHPTLNNRVGNNENLLLILKTKKGFILGAFNDYPINKNIIPGKGFLYSLTNKFTLDLLELSKNENARVTKPDESCLIWGNSDLRITKKNVPKDNSMVYSTINAVNTYFNAKTKKKELNDFLGEGKKDTAEIDSYELYQINFE